MFYIYQNSYGAWDIAKRTNAQPPANQDLAVIRAPMFKTRQAAIEWAAQHGITF